jgi:chorismate mutase
MHEGEFFLVKAEVLPEVFLKVMEVKRLLSAGKADSVNEAVQRVGISRSAYYKYKDSLFPFYETSRGRIVTVMFVIEDFPGILSGIINCLADAKANILTINQNIPINGLADVTVSVETDRMKTSLEELMDRLGAIQGVRRQRIMARD